MASQIGNAIAGRFRLPSTIPADCADLIQRMLTVDPHKRATIEEIRTHPFLTSRLGEIPSCLPPRSKLSILDYNIVHNLMDVGYSKGEIEANLLGHLTKTPVYQLYWIMYDHQQKKEKLERKLNEDHPIDPNCYKRNFTKNNFST